MACVTKNQPGFGLPLITNEAEIRQLKKKCSRGEKVRSGKEETKTCQLLSLTFTDTTGISSAEWSATLQAVEWRAPAADQSPDSQRATSSK